MNMVERVAAIIHYRSHGKGDAFCQKCEAVARDAIEAMREPTASMMLAHSGRPRTSMNGVNHLDAEAVHAWRSMIDAALTGD